MTPRLVRNALLGAVVLITALLIYRIVQLKLGPATVDAPNTPMVSVTSMAAVTTPTLVSFTGTISARYDIPVGVEGDGGTVSQVLVEAGDRVKRGQLLARLNTTVLRPQVASLEAGLEQARAESDLAKAEAQRAERVGKSGALSAEEAQRRRSSALSADARVKLAAAQLAEAQARLGRTEVRAPADGTILTRNVEVGQSAMAGGTALFRLSEHGDVELQGQVAEQDLPLLRVGQTATIRLTGIEQAFSGEVRLLGAVIDPQTRLGSVRIKLSPDPNLRPGAFAHAEVTVARANRAILPQTAVLSDAEGTYVMIVNERNHVERRAVQTAGTLPAGVLIIGGLRNTDRIVTSAGAFLEPGETVRVKMAKG